MTLDNKLGLKDDIKLAHEEERLSKKEHWNYTIINLWIPLKLEPLKD
jgi:hypothetical protein